MYFPVTLTVAAAAGAEKEPFPIKFKLARRFYEPIYLDAALKEVDRQGPSGHQRESNSLEDSTDDAEEAFHCFVNRLADICDNGAFGKTVSAVAVLEECDCKHYIIGSNRRDDSDVERVKVFVEKLVEIVQSHLGRSSRSDDLRDLLFSHILHFNRDRFQRYAGKMAGFLKECIEDHIRRHPAESDAGPVTPAQRLRVRLSELLRMTEFQIEGQSEGNKISSLAQCEALMKHIHQLDADVEFKDGISEQAQDGQAFPRSSWIEFKHYLGRLKSYRLAIDTIIRMGRRFPDLFHETRITVIPSARFREAVTWSGKSNTNAHGIIGRMLQNEKEIEMWRRRVADLQQFGLDESIARQVQAPARSLTVHAEILVLDWVLRYMRGGEDPVGFWKGWRYIGSSKPTCRLCDYYMTAHPSRVKVRKSHGNLYPSWRVPAVFNKEEEVARDRLLNEIVRRVREDVLRVIESKQPLGRPHDSNSNSQLPDLLRMAESSVSNLESYFSSLDISSQRGGLPL